MSTDQSIGYNSSWQFSSNISISKLGYRMKAQDHFLSSDLTSKLIENY